MDSIFTLEERKLRSGAPKFPQPAFLELLAGLKIFTARGAQGAGSVERAVVWDAIRPVAQQDDVIPVLRSTERHADRFQR
jgi:hypothetical protein